VERFGSRSGRNDWHPVANETPAPESGRAIAVAIATDWIYDGDVQIDINADAVAGALREIARGFDTLADAVAGQPSPQEERTLAVLIEWGHAGLDREQASALFRRHGFAPQTAGGWSRADWIETRCDGLRYLTRQSHDWVEQKRKERSDA
jgi:hypothetical protein